VLVMGLVAMQIVEAQAQLDPVRDEKEAVEAKPPTTRVVIKVIEKATREPVLGATLVLACGNRTDAAISGDIGIGVIDRVACQLSTETLTIYYGDNTFTSVISPGPQSKTIEIVIAPDPTVCCFGFDEDALHPDDPLNEIRPWSADGPAGIGTTPRSTWSKLRFGMASQSSLPQLMNGEWRLPAGIAVPNELINALDIQNASSPKDMRRGIAGAMNVDDSLLQYSPFQASLRARLGRELQLAGHLVGPWPESEAAWYRVAGLVEQPSNQAEGLFVHVIGHLHFRTGTGYTDRNRFFVRAGVHSIVDIGVRKTNPWLMLQSQHLWLGRRLLLGTAMFAELVANSREINQGRISEEIRSNYRIGNSRTHFEAVAGIAAINEDAGTYTADWSALFVKSQRQVHGFHTGIVGLRTERGIPGRESAIRQWLPTVKYNWDVSNDGDTYLVASWQRLSNDRSDNPLRSRPYADAAQPSDIATRNGYVDDVWAGINKDVSDLSSDCRSSGFIAGAAVRGRSYLPVDGSARVIDIGIDAWLRLRDGRRRLSIEVSTLENIATIKAVTPHKVSKHLDMEYSAIARGRRPTAAPANARNAFAAGAEITAAFHRPESRTYSIGADAFVDEQQKITANVSLRIATSSP
jgi:hypothetical protein